MVSIKSLLVERPEIALDLGVWSGQPGELACISRVRCRGLSLYLRVHCTVSSQFDVIRALALPSHGFVRET